MHEHPAMEELGDIPPSVFTYLLSCCRISSQEAFSCQPRSAKYLCMYIKRNPQGSLVVNVMQRQALNPEVVFGYSTKF